MKFSNLLSVGLVFAAAVAAPPVASAQDYHRDRVVTRTVHSERHDDRPSARQVCRTEYRHHRRVRTCRTVRY